MITQHVRNRIAQRVSDPTEQAMIASACESATDAAARLNATDAAVRVWRAASKVEASDGSNGDTAVLIVRTGPTLIDEGDCYRLTERTQGVTLMWRRATQPHTTHALRVNK